MAERIDRSRGAYIKIAGNGMRVAMYADRPGEYVDANNQPVSKETARDAGFDVKLHEREKRKQDLRDNVDQMIDVNFSECQEQLERLMEDNENLDPKKMQIKPFRDDYGLFDQSGQQISPRPISYEEAAVIYKGLAGVKYESKGSGSAGSRRPGPKKGAGGKKSSASGESDMSSEGSEVGDSAEGADGLV